MKENNEKIMGTKQPNTINMNGVEVPSWYFMWCKLNKINESIDRLQENDILHAIAIIALAIGLLLK